MFLYKIIKILIAFFIILIVASRFLDKTIDPVSVHGESRLPRCEARSTAEPGRLNIDSGAQMYGLTPPCKSFLDFFIFKNTLLRSIQASIYLTGTNSSNLPSEALIFELNPPLQGMRIKKQDIATIQADACKNIKVTLHIKECIGEQNKRIQCPPILVKTSMSFNDFDVTGDGLNICYDD